MRPISSTSMTAFPKGNLNQIARDAKREAKPYITAKQRAEIVRGDIVEMWEDYEQQIEVARKARRNTSFENAAKKTAQDILNKIAHFLKTNGYNGKPVKEMGLYSARLKDALQCVDIRHRGFLAAKSGIEKVSSVLYTNCDPRAMVIFEKMGGKFDSQGVWGVDPKTVQAAWFLAGCQDTSKFRALLRFEIEILKSKGRSDGHCSPVRIVRKSSTLPQTINIIRGCRFLSNRATNIYLNSPKMVEILGRVSLPLRYALIKGYNETGKLNFEFAAEVQRWRKEEQAWLLRNRESWYFLYNRCPFDGKSEDMPNAAALAMWPKAAGAFASLVKEFDAKGNNGMLIPIFRLCSLFGSVSEVKKWVAMDEEFFRIDTDGMGWSARAVHDAGQFVLPSEKFSAQKWAGFVFKFPQSTIFAAQFARVEKALGRIPSSLAELREVSAQFVYDNCEPKNVELAALCAKFHISQDVFEEYQALMKRVKRFEMLPNVAASVGAYSIRKLGHDDPRGPLLGHFSACCQHLESAGAACAKHGVERPESAFYVVEKNGEIVAQSWAWRSSSDTVVFDSIESQPGQNLNQISCLFELAGRQMVGRLMIKEVLVGQTSYGLTAQVRSFLQSEGNACKNGRADVPLAPCSYMDGRKQWLLIGGENNGVQIYPSDIPEVAPSVAESNNVFQPGSEVYCEHCDAEVHPDAEVCPACFQDISEWV